MADININKAEFIRSAATAKQFIHTSVPKVAFAGKSNVGKSSVINCILNRKNFAKVGAQPGKTIHVNYFFIDQKLYLVDLPGYGYAKVSQTEKDRWGRLMEEYFQTPDMMNLGVFIVDARHKPTADDIVMAEYFLNCGQNFVVVANKIDKCKKSEIEGNLALIRDTLKLPETVEIIPFSAETRLNKEKLISKILGSI